MIATDNLLADAAAELETWHVPALEFVAVRNGEVLHADGVGLRDLERQLLATPNTLFHHGSTGKAFTGALAGTLVDAGLLEWDRPVRDYLPDFRLHEGLLADRITIADLLSHRSGMARHEFVWLANPSLSRAELVRRLRYLPSNLDLRTTFTYSNLAYVTAGHLIATVTGSTWEEQMRQRVLAPLGMTRTVTSVAAAQADADHAQPYALLTGEDGELHLRPIPWRASDQIAPAGQMISCATDIARWLLFQLSDGEVDGKRIISAGALARTKTPHTPFDIQGPDPDIRFHGYAFGWILGTYRGRRLVWHNGGIDGFKTDIALLPDDNIAVAVSCNVLTTEMPFGLAFHTLDVLLGEEPKSWSENLRVQSAAAPTPETPAVVEVTKPSHPLAAYAGTYEHPGYGSLQVAERDGTLAVRLGELEVETSYRHYDTWTLHYEPLDSSWPLTFLTNADGAIDAAEIPLEPSLTPIRFERSGNPAR